ncbi:MAG: ABC transporter ATP-binding protein [Candidatus Thermoplasmatota archaeon]|nr:ABC transporter ATP-binding protein [Candidatus Thermoplasmatota archaeon]
MSRENVVETINLVKSYGKHVALDSINLKIKPGATGLLGPNGAGKSTLFKTILGLISTTSGDGIVLDHNIREEGPIIRSKIGYMPEYDCLNPDLEAIHQVAYSGELLGMNPSIAMQRAHEVLEYVGLKDQRYRTLDTFSTGMKQSAKLACGLIHDPELLIADEPTNGLDAAHRDFMLNTLNQIVNQGGRSLIMASHLMNDVERVCERIVMLHKGKLIAQGKIEDLKAIEREVEVHAWGGASKLEECLNDGGLKVRRTGRVLRVVHVDDSTYDQIISAAAKSGCQIRRMQDHEASLEDLFIRIMETLGYGVKSSDQLLENNPNLKHVDAPLELKNREPLQ